MVKTFNLKNRVILISGGYGFLGSAITESLNYHGANVYVLGRSKDKFKTAFPTLPEADSKNISFFQCDVSSTKSIENAFENIDEKEGKIDVLINNAFYSKGQSPEKMTDEEWAYGIDGSLSSVFRCMRSIIPYFKKSKGGKIINVSSMYGLVAPHFEVYDDFPQFLNPPHYGAAKAGIAQLTQYYASYLGPLNINVNTVTPGPFPSDIVKENKGFVKALSEKTCLGRVGLPEDLAGTFVFLASCAADFITGQNFIVDGGWTAK
mgnify:CR=1 FL=1